MQYGCIGGRNRCGNSTNRDVYRRSRWNGSLRPGQLALISRVIDAVLDLSKHRLAVRKRMGRKNGLEYTERRLVLPEDVEIPGGVPGGDQCR
ncbi:hypothetical protein EA473_00045 [Natrarchaeobius chitinivorans]|uniref:Uncharacterized protein n=1 Tax=Natrarchaeobius chitinivorans TaxID=1679083 RepID=A0A3N6M675_NATCH|nr:hypothetical protein EA473_00045 [Natrarchaeobius chitinivorans]